MASNKFNAALLGSVTAAAMMAAGPVLADEVSDLKAQIEALSQKVQQIETQKAQPAVIPANVVTGGDFPGSYKMPGSNTSIKVGGYAKLDIIYSAANKRADSSGIQGAPAETTGTESNNGHWRFHALQTRFNIDSRTKSEDMGTVRGFVELDFYNSAGGNQVVSNSVNPRLRHGFVSIGNFLAGQTWTTFMGLNSLVDTIDFNGPTGAAFLRQGQLRYSTKLGSNSVAIALENPNPIYTGGGTPGGLGDAADRMPDIVASLKHSGSWGGVQLSAALNYIDGEAAAGVGTDDSAMGWALGFSGRLKLKGKDNIRFQINGGDGGGRYAGVATSPAAHYDANTNSLQLISQIGGYVALQHHWNDKWRSNIVGGGYKANNPGNGASTLIENVVTGHVNLIWNATKKTNIGIEYRYSKSTDENGETGLGSDVQVGVTHSF